MTSRWAELMVDCVNKIFSVFIPFFSLPFFISHFLFLFDQLSSFSLVTSIYGNPCIPKSKQSYSAWIHHSATLIVNKFLSEECSDRRAILLSNVKSWCCVVSYINFASFSYLRWLIHICQKLLTFYVYVWCIKSIMGNIKNPLLTRYLAALID